MNGEDWLQALADRNLTTYIYDDEIIARVLSDIFERYFFCFKTFIFLLKKKPMNKILRQQILIELESAFV